MDELTSVTGHNLHTYHWPPSVPPKGIVFVSHGVGEYSGRYKILADSLNARGFCVAAHDHVGHGHSGGERILIDSIETYARDVIQHVEGIKAKHPDLPVFLFGHSMGGTIAALTVIMRADLFKGVVLSAPSLVADPESAGFFLKLAAKVIGAIFPGMGIKTLNFEGISRIPEEVEKYIEDPLIYKGKLKAGWGAAMLAAYESFQSRLSEITLPILFLHGDVDQLVNIRSSHFGYDSVSSSDKTLEIFEGGYHEGLNDLERERFLTIVGDWIDRIYETREPSAQLEDKTEGPLTGEEPTKEEEPSKEEEPTKEEEPSKEEEPTKEEEPSKEEEPTKEEEPSKEELTKEEEPSKEEEPAGDEGLEGEPTK